MPIPKHHEQFYFTFVTFLVEDCLFRVPRDTLESQSDVFRDLFLLPVQADKAEGYSDTNPIVLEGILKEEFQSLMKVLYPMPFTRLSPSPGGVPGTLEEWTGILKLSKMWSFTRVQEFAIQQMEPMLATRPLDKVALAQDYGVTEWLVPGLLQLARREEPVGLEDVRKLGLDTALKLADIRESAQSTMPTWAGRYYMNPIDRSVEMPVITATGPRGSTSCDFTNRIRQVFNLQE
ncbi:hypothetical protein EDB19DRAFT_1747897 [Suillus lakei]|nr:hypothetical protein EDB19DRAFT_1747897 [Suillus lakei]